jgi:hypothetical protein
MAGGVDSVVKLAKQLQTPVCTTYLRNDAFPKSKKLLEGETLFNLFIKFNVEYLQHAFVKTILNFLSFSKQIIKIENG